MALIRRWFLLAQKRSIRLLSGCCRSTVGCSDVTSGRAADARRRTREEFLFVAAASPLHGRRTLRTVPLPLRSLRQTHTAVVEPLDRTVCVVTADHLTVRNLVADAVSRLVGVVGPVHLAVGLRLGQRRRLLGKLLSQRRRRRARRQ